MSDSGEEFRDVSEGFSLQIGDSIVAYTYPLTEGLIVDRKTSEDGRLAITLLIAPRKEKGKKWQGAKVSLRDAARLFKKPPGKFMFPIKGIEKLKEEAKKVKTDLIWLAAVKTALDKEFRNNDLSSGESEVENREEGEESEDSESNKNSQVKEREVEPAVKKFADLEKRISEILQLKTRKEVVRKSKRDKESDDSDFEQWKKYKRDKRKRKQRSKRKKNKQSSSSSSSASSSSSSEREWRTGEVGRKGLGMFICPFHKSDVRGVHDAKSYIQGQDATRKHIRVALQNLYGAHYTLVSFADKFVGKAYSSPYRPFTVDVAWFQAYAENIDELLLNSLQGPWAMWNEPVIDQMTIGFLDLLMRVSPYKNYPVCLDDSVRKWMKKMRIGTNAKYGPVPFAMQSAKFTDGGVVVHQAGVPRSKERFQSNFKQGNNNGANNNTHNRPGNMPPSGGEKRPPPSS